MTGPTSSDREIHAQIARLARALHTSTGRNAGSPEAVMGEVTGAAVTLLPDVDHAAINLVRNQRRKRTIESAAPTGAVPATIARLQDDLDMGPCLTAIDTEQTVRVDDFSIDERWPQFAAAVVEKTAVRAGLSIPLFADDSEIGALTLYSETPKVFTDETVDQAVALATHGAIGLSDARRSEQFRSALASRDIIGQAKGIIMERFDIDATQAFRLLTELSQTENIRLAEVARQLIEKDHPEPDPGVATS